jgi:hypothetical protein
MKNILPVLSLVTLTATTHAAIIASGLRDIVITSNFDGVYLDVDAGTTVAVEAIGWDINPFFGGEGVANSPSFQPVRATVNVSSAILNLSPGQSVDASSSYATTYAGSASHVGPAGGQFDSGVEGYIGFMLTTNESAGPYYGWMRLILANDGSTGLIRDWAYEDTGSAITVAAVPEPATVTFLSACALGFAFHRRRK